MRKAYDLKTVIIDNIAVNYFYTKEKTDRNGNPRYRVFMLDSEAPAVYEKIFCTYNLESSIKHFLEGLLNEKAEDQEV